MIKRLRPPVPQPPSTPRCEFECKGYWSPGFEGDVRKDGTKQCSHSSSYEINGAHLCTSHARARALELLENEEHVLVSREELVALLQCAKQGGVPAGCIGLFETLLGEGDEAEI